MSLLMNKLFVRIKQTELIAVKCFGKSHNAVFIVVTKFYENDPSTPDRLALIQRLSNFFSSVFF